MANEKILSTIIILRHDEANVWATSEVVLQKGELGLSYDNGNVIVKAGNGVDKWPDLKPIDETIRQGLASEITRATDAETALGARIDALSDKVDGIDFVDQSELEDAIKDFATTSELNTAVEGLEKAISEIVHFTTKVVSSTEEMTETGVLYLLKDESVTGIDKYNEYIVVDGEPVLIGDTTTDLSDYYTKSEVDTEIQAFEESVANSLEAIEEEIGTKLSAADFEAFQTTNTEAIATAKQEAIDAAAAAEEAKGYATTSFVTAELAKKIDSASIAHTSEGIAEGVTVTGTSMSIVVDSYTKAETREYVADVIADMTGGESAADVKLALENHIKTYEAKVAEIDTKDNTQDESLQALVEYVADVYTKEEADEAFMTQTEVDDRINALIVASDPEGGKTISDIQNLVKYVDENAGEIAALITAVNENKEDIAALTTSVGENAAAIAENLTAITKNTADIASINEAIAAIVQPKASEEVTVAEDGTLGLGKVSTDKLEMGTQTIIIDGGSATI